MEIQVLYFAVVRERLGMAQESFSLEGYEELDVATFWGHLCEKHSELQPLRAHLRLSVNSEFANAETLIRDGDEVAIIPPVAGGIDEPLRLSDEPLDEAAVVKRVTREEAGALVTFVGVVRNHARGCAVEFLEYEAYPAMANRKLEQVEREVEEKFPSARCAVCHRYGRLEIGEVAVVIAVTTPHRAAAFAACEWAIDRVKEVVPIWKREVGPDGSVWVGMGS